MYNKKKKNNISLSSENYLKRKFFNKLIRIYVVRSMMQSCGSKIKYFFDFSKLIYNVNIFSNYVILTIHSIMVLTKNNNLSFFIYSLIRLIFYKNRFNCFHRKLNYRITRLNVTIY